MRRSALVLFAVAAVAVIACGSGTATSDQAGKYEQTWTTSYRDTTCADWRARMNSHERWVAAADMLISVRSHDGDEGLPPDSMITEFEGGVSNVCSEPDLAATSIAEVGALLYVTERARFAP
jgi:hypothetical protein